MDILMECIEKIRSIHQSINPQRIEYREKCESNAIKIINENLGNINESQLDDILYNINADLNRKGKVIQNRFGSTFTGQNYNAIKSNSLDKINNLILKIYNDENLNDVDYDLESLNGLSKGFVSALLYLKNRDKYNIFLKRPERGLLNCLMMTNRFKGNLKERYNNFNNNINKIKTECAKYNLFLKPQEIDIIFSRLEDEKINRENKFNGKTKLVREKQIILYGPPGTGKTFKSREKSVLILEDVL